MSTTTTTTATHQKTPVLSHYTTGNNDPAGHRFYHNAEIPNQLSSKKIRQQEHSLKSRFLFRLSGGFGDFDVGEVFLADCAEGVHICRLVDESASSCYVPLTSWAGHGNRGQRERGVWCHLQTPIQIPQSESPVTAFLSRYGRRARRRAAPAR